MKYKFYINKSKSVMLDLNEVTAVFLNENDTATVKLKNKDDFTMHRSTAMELIDYMIDK